MYTTWGDVRGQGPVRATRREAESDLDVDRDGCRLQGGFSDREVYGVDSDGYLIDNDGRAVYPSSGRSCGAVRAVIEEHDLEASPAVFGAVLRCSCGWRHAVRETCRPQAWPQAREAWLAHANDTDAAAAAWAAVVA